MIKKFEELNYYELLRIPPNASSFEIRQAYKSVLAIYEECALATYSLFLDDERRAILAKIEEAFLTLIDDRKRDAYDDNLVNLGEIPKSTLAERGRKKAIPIFQINKAKNNTNHLTRIRRKIQEKGSKELADTVLDGKAISGGYLNWRTCCLRF